MQIQDANHYLTDIHDQCKRWHADIDEVVVLCKQLSGLNATSQRLQALKKAVVLLDRIYQTHTAQKLERLLGQDRTIKQKMVQIREFDAKVNAEVLQSAKQSLRHQSDELKLEWQACVTAFKSELDLFIARILKHLKTLKEKRHAQILSARQQALGV